MKKDVREETNIDERMKDFQKTNAIRTGNQYFDSIEASLQSELEDVKRQRKHWLEAMNDGKYPDGKPLGNDLKVNEIVWTMHSLQQLNLYHELGARAIARIAVAFDVDL